MQKIRQKKSGSLDIRYGDENEGELKRATFFRSLNLQQYLMGAKTMILHFSLSHKKKKPFFMEEIKAICVC